MSEANLLPMKNSAPFYVLFREPALVVGDGDLS